MKKFILVLIIFFNALSLVAQQDPFLLYVEKDVDWYPSIFELYIKEYSDLDVNRYLISGQDISTIKLALEQFDYTETEDVSEALAAVQKGKKVFFFIETWVWGGLEQGTTFSGSWQQQMPMVSGFYVYKKKCFQNEGLNYHCGKKENAHKVVFYIMEE